MVLSDQSRAKLKKIVVKTRSKPKANNLRNCEPNQLKPIQNIENWNSRSSINSEKLNLPPIKC